MTLAEKIFNCFKDNESFSLKEAYQQNADKPKETVRARIYEKIGIRFERISKGVYCTIDNKDEQCILIEGDGRDLSMLGDNSIDCILTDHPWLDKKSNKGGTRAFAEYDCFRYTLATVYKGNIIKNLIMDCQSYTKYRPNETTGGIFVSWRRKEELPTGA